MAKKTVVRSDSDGVYTIGLDIGYGVTKAVMNSTTLMFPSVVAHSRPIQFQSDEIAAKYPGDQISDDEGDWFVGNLAMSQALAGELLRLRGRSAHENEVGNVFRLRLAKVAIGKLFTDLHNGEAIHIRIATGLPVDHMRGAAELKAALIGQHVIQTDSAQFVANVTEVMVMPQPYGTIYSKMLTRAGDVDPCHTAKRTGVIDVGTYTVDLALDDDGEYIETRSGSIESGVYMAQQRISSAVEAEYNQKPTYKTIEGILKTGCIKVGKQTYDYRTVVDSALEPIRSATLAFIQEKWQAGLEVDVAYLAGGGAALVAEHIMSIYPQAVLLENAQTANAQGYVNYALFAQKE